MYGLNLAKQGKMVDCINNANFIVDGGNNAYDVLKQNMTLYGGLLAIDEGLKVVYAAGGLSSDCINGALESKDNALKYITFISTPSLLYLNLIYNFGLLYDSVKSFVYFFWRP